MSRTITIELGPMFAGLDPLTAEERDQVRDLYARMLEEAFTAEYPDASVQIIPSDIADQVKADVAADSWEEFEEIDDAAKDLCGYVWEQTLQAFVARS